MLEQFVKQIFVSQVKYAKSLGSKFGIDTTKHRKNPIGTHEKITRYEAGNVMRIKAQRIRDAGASKTFIRNPILIMENSNSGGCETLEKPNIFLYPSVFSFITILIWSFLF